MVPKFFISFATESSSSGYVTESGTFWGEQSRWRYSLLSLSYQFFFCYARPDPGEGGNRA